jgi:hypothetical protein
MKQMNEREACDMLRKSGLTEEQIENLRKFRLLCTERERESIALAHSPVRRETWLERMIQRIFGNRV